MEKVKRNIGRTVKWEQQQKNFVVRFLNFAKNETFCLIGEQRPAPARNDDIAKIILRGLFQNVSRLPEDWKVCSPCRLYSERLEE